LKFPGFFLGFEGVREGFRVSRVVLQRGEEESHGYAAPRSGSSRFPVKKNVGRM